MEKTDISSMTLPRLTEWVTGTLGEPTFRAGQIYRWIHQKRVGSFAEMTNLSAALRQKLEESAFLTVLTTRRRLESKLDETVKLLLELPDQNCVEAVLMRYEHGLSLCISTQVGCRMGCKFCASTLGGLVRSLTPAEMLGEVYEAERQAGEPISSLVLMGIGEPLDNYRNVLDFLTILSSPEGRNLSLRHVSLSTCGLCDRIDELAELGLGLTLSILFLALMYKVAQIPFKMILKSLKPILPIVVFTAVLNLFFVSGEGDPLVKLGFLTIYAEGVRYAVLMAVRVMALIAGTSLLTYTTSPIVLTDAIEQLLKPLGKLHFPVHELAMMMSIALRFIPTLIEETDKIMNAQKARGAQLDTGKMTDRVKALVPVLIPLFISAFRRADELAMAMECRCYRGGTGRTRLKVLRCEKQDYIDLAVCIACFAVILASRLVFPNY